MSQPLKVDVDSDDDEDEEEEDVVVTKHKYYTRNGHNTQDPKLEDMYAFHPAPPSSITRKKTPNGWELEDGEVEGYKLIFWDTGAFPAFAERVREYIDDNEDEILWFCRPKRIGRKTQVSLPPPINAFINTKETKAFIHKESHTKMNMLVKNIYYTGGGYGASTRKTTAVKFERC